MRRVSIARVLAPTVLVAALIGGFAASSASAAILDACGVTSERQIAKAFDLADAVEHKALIAAPGNPSGVLRDRCRVFAWRGAKPANDKLKREALLEGRLAWLNVQTWVTDESPFAPTWLAHFDAERKAIRAASVELFLKRLGGEALVPQRYGADEGILYVGSTAKVTKARGLWWKRSDRSMIELNVETAKSKPALGSLKRIASVMVERFNTECSSSPCGAAVGG